MRSQCISDSHEHKKEEEGFGHRPADLMRLGEPDREHQGNDCPLWASCTRWSRPVISRTSKGEQDGGLKPEVDPEDSELAVHRL